MSLIFVVDQQQVAGQSGEEPGKKNEQANPVEGALSAIRNFPLPTMGGKQFWTDFAWNDGWRLQQNAITEHWRLISPKNVRYAWGNRLECESAMERHVAQQTRQPDSRIIVMLHGLMRTSASMSQVGKALEDAGIVRPVCFEYASTRRGVAAHAAALRHWLETLPGEPRIDFVAHSMGNIVIRHLIMDLQRDGDPRGLLARSSKFAMLGPPNHGANIARQLGKLGLFEIVTGQGGMELGPAWEAFEHRLAIPPFPFMIVAGDLQKSWLKNPLVEGPSDLVVRTEEANLEGAAAFHVLPVMHSLMMNDSTVQQLVVDFLSS
ncbi:esterase/lipase family protein [Planctomycetaceae bacterium SH139]